MNDSPGQRSAGAGFRSFAGFVGGTGLVVVLVAIAVAQVDVAAQLYWQAFEFLARLTAVELRTSDGERPRSPASDAPEEFALSGASCRGLGPGLRSWRVSGISSRSPSSGYGCCACRSIRSGGRSATPLPLRPSTGISCRPGGWPSRRPSPCSGRCSRRGRFTTGPACLRPQGRGRRRYRNGRFGPVPAGGWRAGSKRRPSTLRQVRWAWYRSPLPAPWHGAAVRSTVTTGARSRSPSCLRRCCWRTWRRRCWRRSCFRIRCTRPSFCRRCLALTRRRILRAGRHPVGRGASGTGA